MKLLSNLKLLTKIKIKGHIQQGIAGSFVLKLVFTGFNVVAAILVARILGVEGFGLYVFCLSVVRLLLIPSTFGLQELLVREAAYYSSQRKNNELHGIIRWSFGICLIVSLCIASAAILIAFFLIESTNSVFKYTFAVAVILIPLFSLLHISAAILRGFRFILLGQLPQQFIRPFLFLLFLLTGFIVFRFEFSTVDTMILQVIATFTTLICIVVFLIKWIPWDFLSVTPCYHSKLWLRSALPLMLFYGMEEINREAALIILGGLGGSAEVGIFSIAQRIAQLVAFGVIAVNITISPTVSILYAENRMTQLRHLVKKSTAVIVLISAVIALFLFLWGPFFIRSFLDSQFHESILPMFILCIGQIFYALTGNLGIVLNMTHKEQNTMICMMIATGSNIVLNLLLVPLHGPVGAAIASSLSFLLLSMLLLMSVYKHYRFLPFPFL